MREFLNYFADAEESFGNARFVIFGLPYDKTSSFRLGARLAPDDIRKASWNFESFDILFQVDFREIPMHDYGNLNIEDKLISDMIKDVRGFSKKIVEADKIPVAIGGEHSVTPGIISAFSDVFVVFLDAHLDFRNEYENNRFNHACALRRVCDEVGVKNAVTLGIRSAEKKELEEAQEMGLKFFTSRDVAKNLDGIISETLEISSGKKIYLSLDFDVIDPAYAPGVSTPEPFGLKPDDVLRMIKAFADRIVGFDVVEVCPPYDLGITSVLAAKMIRSIIAEIWKASDFKSCE